MGRNLTIRIRRRSQPQWLVWLLILAPFSFGLLNDILRLPDAIHYGLDVAWMLLLLIMCRFNRSIETKKVRSFSVWVIVFVIYTLATYLAQFVSPLYYLWGVRNNFRMYVAFFAFAVFLSCTDAEEYLKLFDKLFWINAAVSLFQFFIMGIDGDNLGGIFGTDKGVNGYTNLFFSIILVRSIIMYLDKKDTIWNCAGKCATALLIAVLAELKFFFIEVLLIIVLTVLLTEFTWRKFWIVAGGTAAVIIGALALAKLFPVFSGWFSLERILNAASASKGYTSSGDLNRLNAIDRINDLWLTSGWKQLFGLGMGNCDTASFAILNTPFYAKYGRMHYSWISYAHMYLECGWIGLIFFWGFFVLLLVKVNQIRKNCSGIRHTYCRISMIMAIICIMITVYNSSLRTEAGYMAYFVLALPFVKHE